MVPGTPQRAAGGWDGGGHLGSKGLSCSCSSLPPSLCLGAPQPGCVAEAWQVAGFHRAGEGVSWA